MDLGSEYLITQFGVQDSPYAKPLEMIQLGQASGPLRVDKNNPRYFTDGSGRAIYLTGSHTWCNFIDCGSVDPPTIFNFTAYLDFLTKNHQNFFRLWRAENAMGGENGDDFWFSPLPYERTGPGTALDGKPRFNLDKFNQTYFDRMRSRIIEAGQRGIYVSIMLFDGWSIGSKLQTHNPWIGHPMNDRNNINGIDGDINGDGQGWETHTLQNSTITAYQEAYVRKVIDTVNDLDNVLYEISNEDTATSGSLAWQSYIIDYIKSYEATKLKQHPVGMTALYPGGNNVDLFSSSADWISPNGDVNNPIIADGSKVILNDTDHLCGICGDRKWVWKSFTRGLNPIFMDPYDGEATGRGAPIGYDPNNPNDVSIRINLGYALTYANRMNLVAMAPRGDLASSGYMLANPTAIGAEYLVYLPNGGSVTVNLSATPGTLNLEWFNPAMGTTTNAGTVSGGTSHNFNVPFSGDAVLYIYQEIPPGTQISPPTEVPTPDPTLSPYRQFLPQLFKIASLREYEKCRICLNQH